MRRWIVLVAAACVAVTTWATVPTFADSSPSGQLVNQIAASGTPHVLDGRVLSVTRVGDTVVLGGEFTTARNDDSQTVLNRSNLLAFDANTGQISTTFAPNPNGVVQKVVDAGDGETVYVGGAFTNLAGVSRQRIARIRISDGSVVQTFNAGTVSGQVRDADLLNGRLWISGAFTHVGGSARPAMATLNPTTGARTAFMALPIAGLHNGGTTQVIKFAASPDGSRIIAIGNFDTLNGVVNHQLFVLDTSGAAAAPSTFRTSFYTQACSSSFDSYMRDVDVSPDGRFFVVSTTGAYGGSSAPCDTTARFEVESAGTNIAPSWVNYTGGDTTYAVEVTDAVVYVGGHFRWQNNAFRGDQAGQGAIAREGIAALDPINGLPYSWNPGRTKGVGVFDFLNTAQGLWVASDTDRINFQLKSRIARMRPDGVVFPRVRTPQLPDDLYQVGGALNLLNPFSKRAMAPGSVGAQQNLATGGINWSQVRGSFMINGWLYTALSTGTFVRRTFDGTTFGAVEAVNTSDQIAAFTDWRSDATTATGMFYDSGRIYFTLPNSSQLFYRYFTAESGAVGAKRLVASGNVAGIDFTQVRGMFATADALYWATPDGRLRRIDWAQGAISGAPVANTATIVSGQGVDANTWNSRAYFLFQDPLGNPVGPNQSPTASFLASCDDLDCSFDASASSDPDGQVTSWAWDFGDGEVGTGQTASHTYAEPGDYQVTLTVADAQAATGSTSQPVQATAPPEVLVQYVDGAAANANVATHRVRIPTGVLEGDTLVLQMGLNTTTPTVATPAGWTLLRQASEAGIAGRLWTKTATATDAGTLVDVVLSAAAKADLTVTAYRAPGGQTAVLDSAVVVDATVATQHRAPAVTVPEGAWVGSYWAVKASVATSLTPSAGVTRATTSGAGGGGMYALAVDSGAPAAPGAWPGELVTTSPDAGRLVMFSVVVGVP